MPQRRNIRPALRRAATLPLLLLVAGCAAVGALPLPGPSSLVDRPISCPPLQEAAAEARLYFGMEKGDGSAVSEAEWIAFLDEEVTPRFPDGLTVLDAYGQWRAAPGAPIQKEATKVLVIVVSDYRGSLPDLRALAGTYKHRFRQQSVLLTAKPVCAAF